jgi:predicted outer membrane repeat protein
MRNSLLTLLIIGIAANSSATIINIPADYPTIQQGIDASADGDTVLVQPGTYVENVDFNGHNILLGSLFLTTGDTSYIEQTVIDGDSAGSVVTFVDNSFVNPTLITGFTIQNGFAISGAGIHCYQSNPIISHSIISNNMAITRGGGIRIDDSEPLIYDNVITNNTAIHTGKGGGIYCLESDAIVRKNRITNNNVYASGGGIFCTSNIYVLIDSNLIENNYAAWGGGIDSYHSDIEISNNTIRQNTCEYRGGAIKCSDSTVILINNTIIENNSFGYGGGIYCDSLEIYIIGNTISGNNATGGYGGGICGVDADISIESNIIRENSCYNSGGGISNTVCNVSIIDNIIDNNTAAGGGGMINAYSTTFIYGNIISNNNADYSGGGIRSHNNQWSYRDNIYNNIIFNNTAENGGGIYCGGSICMMRNNVIALNTANTQGGGYMEGGSDVMLSNSILWANQSPIDPEIAILGDTNLSVVYCDVQGGWPGTGNIDIDPIFRDPSGGDFHLMSTACGDILDSLLDCSWGLGGPRSDMGAYGGGDSATTGIETIINALPADFLLLRNYPNPFNNSTKIEFTIKRQNKIELVIYDILGRKITTLFSGTVGAGAHLIRWDGLDSQGSRVKSGNYFCRITAGDNSSARKLLLLR